MVKTQEPIMLKTGAAGRLMVSDILPLLISSSDTLHNDFGRGFLEKLATEDGYEDKIRRYIRDFRTIRLNAGQRMGHTSAIVMLAKPGDLVVSLNTEFSLHTRSHMIPGVECIGRRKLLEASHKFHNAHPTIWLDGFSMWPRTSMNEIRNRLIKNGDQRMIILG